jgi:hypothetical protein
MFPAVARIDVSDYLFSPTRLDVNVDIGWTFSCGRQETLKEQSERDGIGIRNAKRVTNR